jgi:hypothetical protein
MQLKTYWKGLLALTALGLLIWIAYQKGWVGTPSTPQVAALSSPSFAIDARPSHLGLLKGRSKCHGESQSCRRAHVA